MEYFGWSTGDAGRTGVCPAALELVLANIEERSAAEEVLAVVFNNDIFDNQGLWTIGNHKN